MTRAVQVMRRSLRAARQAAAPLLLALALPEVFAWSPLASRLSLVVSAVLVFVAATVARDAVRRATSQADPVQQATAAGTGDLTPARAAA